MIKEISEYDKKVLIRAIEHYGEKNQKIVAMEELAELQKEIAKDLRGEGNTYCLAEEIADVLIVITQIRMLYDYIDKKIEMYWDHKIERLNERLRDAGAQDNNW